MTISEMKTQRNNRDVALELTKLYYNQNAILEEGELEKKYAKFYALASYLSDSDVDDLKKLVPEDILTRLTKFN